MLCSPRIIKARLVHSASMARTPAKLLASYGAWQVHAWTCQVLKERVVCVRPDVASGDFACSPKEKGCPQAEHSGELHGAVGLHCTTASVRTPLIRIVRTRRHRVLFAAHWPSACVVCCALLGIETLGWKKLKRVSRELVRWACWMNSPEATFLLCFVTSLFYL